MAVIAMGIILMVGFVVVVVTIAVRFGNMGKTEEAGISAPVSSEASQEAFALPVGAEVLSTALSGRELAMTVREGESLVIYLISLPEGTLLSRTVISE